MGKKDLLNHGGSRSGSNFRGINTQDDPDETGVALAHRHVDNYCRRGQECKDPKVTYQDSMNARPNKVHRERLNLGGAHKHVRN